MNHKSQRNQLFQKFPYNFQKRKEFRRKEHVCHSRLNENRFDIAFEIEWENLTPIAHNPVVEQSLPSAPFNTNGKPLMPDKDPTGEKYYQGYNKRWLTIDNKLAISPFTVKSAIANAFANIMGGCYRVVSDIVGHPSKIEEGQYYYTGKYRRYRVAMDSSKPGIILEIRKNEDGSRYVKIQPVKEFYYDQEKLPPFITNQDDVAYIKSFIEDEKRKKYHKPPIIKELSQKGLKEKEVIYYGRYFDGMDAKGNHNKHKHRFYQKIGFPVQGIISQENFLNVEKLKDIVYMGDFKKQKDGTVWYEDLTTLKEGDFVYYQMFNGKVTNIGKCFQFKALFCIDDAILEGFSLCNNSDNLCPRCSMFGMTVHGEEHGGYTGKFKASTLIGKTIIKEIKAKTTIPVEGRTQTIETSVLVDPQGKAIVKQYLLPIQGQPKPNKRDVDGYFEKSSGLIKGAKYYHHTKCNIEKLVSETDQKTNLPDTDLPYTHELRSFAQVLTEKETFSGVVGAENCSIDEICALILILQSTLSNNAFKIGTGKALGLGTMISRIKRVWIRSKEAYDWKAYSSLSEFLKEHQNIATELEKMKKSTIIANTIRFENGVPRLSEQKLTYPVPKNYWKKAKEWGLG